MASKNAFRSGELTAIGPIYSRSRQRQVRNLLSRTRLALSFTDRSSDGARMRYASLRGATLAATAAIASLAAQAGERYLVITEEIGIGPPPARFTERVILPPSQPLYRILTY